MRIFTALLATIALAVPALAVPGPPRSVRKYGGATTGRYIVKLKDGATKASVLGQGKAKYTYADWEIINGFASKLDTKTLNSLLSNPDVEYIEEDGIMHNMETQTDAPWGLSRLSSNAKLTNQDTSALTYSYTYDAAAGTGVDIYIIDTGVRTTHLDFGGRATFNTTFGGHAAVDGNGHGTHVAGTAAGSRYGVAKAASIIGVKVLDDAGSGAVADIVSGLDFVLSSVRISGRPSIASMSLGGLPSSSLDDAVKSLIENNIHVTVAAGNKNTDAILTSPARVESAVTVAASTIDDARASFSNYGSVVDIFAPGQNIISAWFRSDTDTNNISGTSMATPHVAGLIAYLISLEGNMSPAGMSNKIKSMSLKGSLTLGLIPSLTTDNFLAHNARL
ncbi:putative peptidase S8 family protein [Lyophyllum shimeji]|uniref:Peptidase S8 family protein n=1 Tax=Lyophyllum shimeji TaxID=47721 RepID=A0A9P3UPE6_LYOSH|nr:putative peptidase S8 family protein [Lyophyllum shimeji]